MVDQQPAGPPRRRLRGGPALPRSLAALALWAGPIGLGLALVLLLASAAAGHFRSGPGVPSAGDSRAWRSMWGALGLVLAGTAAGLLANAVWLVATVRAAKRPGAVEWFRAALHAAMAALLWLAMGAG